MKSAREEGKSLQVEGRPKTEIQTVYFLKPGDWGENKPVREQIPPKPLFKGVEMSVGLCSSLWNQGCMPNNGGTVVVNPKSAPWM